MRGIEVYSHVKLGVQSCCDKDARVLEVGCGPGQYRGCVAGRYVGVDITAEDYKPGVPRTPDAVADACVLPFADGLFDVVFFAASLYQVPQPRLALRESWRVLKPRGKLLVFDYNRRTQRRLQVGEGAGRPCWNQWQLAGLLAAQGFQKVELRLPGARRGPLGHPWLKPLWLTWNELHGSWAIVFAEK